MAQGVVIPKGQRSDIDEPDVGTPLTVPNAVLGFICPVKWYDKMGSPHTEMVFVVGDVVYRDPNGEDWASSLRTFIDPVAGTIKAAVRAQFVNLVADALKELGVIVTNDPPTRVLSEVDAVADAIYDADSAAAP